MRNILNNKFIMCIMILLFFKPICFQYFSNLLIIDDLFVYGKILVALIVIFDAFIRIYPRLKINYLTLSVFLFEFWIFAITIYNSGDIFRSLIDMVTIVVLVIMIQRFLSIDRIKTLSAIKYVLLSLTLFQLISILIYPSGIPADLYLNNSSNPLFFVTLDNGTAGLVCLTISLIYLNKGNNRRDQVLNFFQVSLCLLTAILSGSSTAIGCAILLILFIFFSKEKFMKIFDKWGIWLFVYLVITALIVTNNEIINDVFIFITGKDGFTGRYHLWSRAIELIKASPLVGYGRISGDYIIAWGGTFSSHNVILEMMLYGGIPAFIFWLSILVICFRKTEKIIDFKLRRILILTVFIVLISLAMESKVHSEFLFLILSILWNYAMFGGEKYEKEKS